MRLLVVCGHGKKVNGTYDSGAAGNGYTEAERVRTLANRMKALGGDSVVIGDQSRKWLDFGLYNSVSKSTFDCAIELHMDSGAPSAKGGHVIYKAGFTPDRYDIALRDFISGYFPGRSASLVGRGDLGVVNACASRGINFRLLEVCFISNAGDINRFNSNLDAVAKGILSAFGIGSAAPALTEAKNPKHRNISTQIYRKHWCDWYFGDREVEGKQFKKISNLGSGGYLSVTKELKAGQKVKTYDKLSDAEPKQAFLLQEIKDVQITDGVGYHIVCAYDTSLCLTLNQEAYDNIELQKVKDNDTSQVWFVKRNPDGTSYQIICSRNGKCLDGGGKYIGSDGSFIE